MTEISTTEVLVRCDHAEIPDDWQRLSGLRREHIVSRGQSANLSFKLLERGGTVLQRVDPRWADLVRIAAYIHRADQIVGRGDSEDVHGERWKRSFRLCIPVLEPEFWNQTLLRDALISTLQFATDDQWQVVFSLLSSFEQQIGLEIDDAESMGEPTTVVLFSGGADSLCAMVDEVRKGERPVAVGHWSAHMHERRQTDLLNLVREQFRNRSFPQIGFESHGLGPEAREYTQRSRGFLYASLGIAVAGSAGIERVVFADNGPISLNLPISGQVVGAAASRSTHPLFQARFNTLARLIYENAPQLENPLAFKTRAEALALLKSAKCEHLLSSTNSCVHWRGQSSATPQCGGCSQCIDRRFATVASRLEHLDPASRYVRDVFIDEFPDWEDRMMAESYVRFAQRVVLMTPADIVAEFGQLYDVITADDPDPDRTLEMWVDVVRRHAETTKQVLATMTNRYMDDLFSLRLPDSCLLRIAIGGVVPALSQPWQKSEPPGSQLEVGNCPRIEFDQNTCRIRFDGLNRSFTRTRGFERLAILLEHPHREFSAAELDVTHTPVSHLPEKPPRLSLLEVDEISVGGRQDVLDEKAIRDIQRELKRLLHQRTAAEDKGDAAGVKKLDREIKDIKRQVEPHMTLGGRSRSFRPPDAAQIDKLYRSMNRAIGEVRTRFPQLASHLADSYQAHSGHFSYRPRGPVNWEIVRPLDMAGHDVSDDGQGLSAS